MGASIQFRTLPFLTVGSVPTDVWLDRKAGIDPKGKAS